LKIMLKNVMARFSELTLVSTAAAVVFLVAHLIEPQTAVLATALVFLAAALISFMRQSPAEQHLLVGVAAAMSLILLGSEALWNAWLAVAGVSTALRSSHLNWRINAGQAALLVGGGTIGLILADSFATDTAVLGLGLIALGQITSLYNRPVLAPSPTDGSVGAAEPAAEPGKLNTRIQVTADGLIRAVDAINKVADQQSSGATEQVDVINLTNNMLDSFLKLSERVRNKARTMSQTADDTNTISKDGQTAIRQAIAGMDQIRSQVSNIGMTITTLAQLTRRIDEIITSVTEIATQSNLLALNASIEAARAGVHGRGFAVVADEVRSLSQQSTTAANQVRAILAEIQSAVRQTINATEIGMQGVDSGVTMTQQADHIMVQLTRNVEASSESVRSIYQVIQQQAEGLEEIAIGMDRIDRITQQNLASTRMVATVASNLTQLADDLRDIVGIVPYPMPEYPSIEDSEQPPPASPGQTWQPSLET
jgi:hypothetical protein